MEASTGLADNRGHQNEGYWAKKPFITIPTETEWVETLQKNWDVLPGPNRGKKVDALHIEIELSGWHELYGNGNTAEEITGMICNELQ